MLPSHDRKGSAPVCMFSELNYPARQPSVYASLLSLTGPQARLEAGIESLLLFRRALSSPTMCRFIPALSVPLSPSPWREFEFALHHVLAAITPRLPLDSVMRCWNQIAEALSEPSRNRRPQLESLF